MKELENLTGNAKSIWEFDCSKCSQKDKNGNLCDICRLTRKLIQESQDEKHR